MKMDVQSMSDKAQTTASLKNIVQCATPEFIARVEGRFPSSKTSPARANNIFRFCSIASACTFSKSAFRFVLPSGVVQLVSSHSGVPAS